MPTTRRWPQQGHARCNARGKSMQRNPTEREGAASLTNRSKLCGLRAGFLQSGVDPGQRVLAVLRIRRARREVNDELINALGLNQLANLVQAFSARNQPFLHSDGVASDSAARGETPGRLPEFFLLEQSAPQLFELGSFNRQAFAMIMKCLVAVDREGHLAGCKG